MEQIKLSINWITPKIEGIGNAAGYAQHNGKMMEHTAKLLDISDTDSKYSFQICPANLFIPMPGKINILFTMWEMLDVPESYIDGLVAADYVIVPCKFCKDLFQPYAKNKIYVVGEGIETDDFPYFKRSEPKYQYGERFRIYWAGAPNPRKGYQYALELIKHIQDNPNIEIYLKTTMPKTNPKDLQDQAQKLIDRGFKQNLTKLKEIASGERSEEYHKTYTGIDSVKVYGKHKNIFFDTRRVPFDELRELYNKAHLFLFPSMGEGWGLMGCEAMGTGCPVLAPPVTGIAEYFSDKVGYALDYGITTVTSSNYHMDARTYTPYFDDMLEKVNHIINNYGEALIKGSKGSRSIHGSFTWKKKADLLKCVLLKIDKAEKINKSIISNKVIKYIKPKMSIYIPTFNMSKQLDQLLNSVRYQNRPDLEVCISDNCSTDNTTEIVEKYNELNIAYRKYPENTGVKNVAEVNGLASGDYIWFMGSDDMIVKGGIDLAFKAIETGTDLVLLNRIDCNKDMHPIVTIYWLDKNTRTYNMPEDRAEYLSKVNLLGGLFSFLSCNVVKREVWESLPPLTTEWSDGGYPHVIKFLYILFRKCSLHYLAKTVVYCRLDDGYVKDHGYEKRKVLDFYWYKKLTNMITDETELLEYKKIFTRAHPKDYIESINTGLLNEYLDYFY